MTTEPVSIQDQIEAAIAEAHSTCDKFGAESKECAAAWDVVEELQAEASHQKQVPTKTSFQVYCENNPEADECRIYED